MYGRKPKRAVRDAWRWRERWRFVEVEAECGLWVKLRQTEEAWVMMDAFFAG